MSEPMKLEPINFAANWRCADCVVTEGLVSNQHWLAKLLSIRDARRRAKAHAREAGHRVEFNYREWLEP